VQDQEGKEKVGESISMLVMVDSFHTLKRDNGFILDGEREVYQVLIYNRPLVPLNSCVNQLLFLGY